jgi:rRNA maturation protein Nop10
MERAPRKVNIRGDEPRVVATYTIEAACPNCDWRGKVEIPKGTPIPKGDTIDAAVCPNCECYTLVRLLKLPTEPATDSDWQTMRRYWEDQAARRTIEQPYTPWVTPHDAGITWVQPSWVQNSGTITSTNPMATESVTTNSIRSALRGMQESLAIAPTESLSNMLESVSAGDRTGYDHYARMSAPINTANSSTTTASPGTILHNAGRPSSTWSGVPMKAPE